MRARFYRTREAGMSAELMTLGALVFAVGCMAAAMAASARATRQLVEFYMQERAEREAYTAEPTDGGAP